MSEDNQPEKVNPEDKIESLKKKLEKVEKEPFKDILNGIATGIMSLIAAAIAFAIFAALIKSAGPQAVMTGLAGGVVAFGIVATYIGVSMLLDNTIKLFAKLLDTTVSLLSGKDLGAEIGYSKLKISAEIAYNQLKKFLSDVATRIFGSSPEQKEHGQKISTLPHK